MKEMKKIISSILLLMISLIAITLFTIYGNSYSEGLVFVIAFISWINSLMLVKAIQIEQRKALWLFVIGFLIMYIMLIYNALTFNAYLHYKLSSFDINKDGIFSGNEQTEEQLRYMKMWAGDVGRNLIWITAIFYSMISSILLEVCSFFYRKARKLIDLMKKTG